MKPEDKTTMTIHRKNKKKMNKIKNDYNFKTHDEVLTALLKIESKFKPELKEYSK